MSDFAEPRRGTTTFLLTDIEGSTRLRETATQEMQATLAWHDAAIGEIVARRDGHLLKTRGEGDSTFSVFARARDAVDAALDIQRVLQHDERAAALPLRVRIAIHTGDAELRDDDYFGPTVNRCARLRAAAHGGQVVLSQATAEICATALPPGASLDDLGIHRLKDLARPEHVFQLSHPDVARAFPPLASLDSRRHNLPVQLTRLIGRERELGSLAEALGRHRLVTLTGIGGVGKTRIALQAAAEAVDRHPDGVWLVELDSVSSERVAAAAATALGLREEPGRAIEDTLAEHLSGRSTLLVLDNCEHVIDASAALAARLLETAAGLRLLATSRQPLGVHGEAVVALSPMTVPTTDDLAAVKESDAAALFLDRAQLVRPGFTLSPADAPALARLCRDLDGVALAIELAAAWVRVLTVPQIADRLADRFRLLTGGSRTASARQQTLLAALEWSYGLLTEDEQHVFRRLAVFPAGTTFAAAAAVIGGDVFDAVVQLVDKSVLVAGDDGRFTMLNTVRAFALRQLQQAGEEAAVRGRELDWAMELARSGDLERIDIEHTNLLDLLAWCQKEAPDQGVELAGALRIFWDMRGHWAIGREVLTRLAGPDSQSVSDQQRAAAFCNAGRLAIPQGDLDAARDLLERAHALAAAQSEPATAREATMNLGNLAAMRGDLRTARAMFTETLEHARATGALSDEGAALFNLGNVAHTEGELMEAAAHYDEAIRAIRATGEENHLPTFLTNRGIVAGSQGDHDTARAFLLDALDLAGKLGNDPQVAAALSVLGRLDARVGNLDEAERQLDEAVRIQRSLGEQAGIAHSLSSLAEVARLRGDTGRAREWAEESEAIATRIGFPILAAGAILELAALDNLAGSFESALDRYRCALDVLVEIDSRPGIAIALDGVAVVVRHRQPEVAAQLLGAASARRTEAGAAEPPDPERARAERETRAALGDECFSRMFGRGVATDVADAVELVRAVSLEP